MRFRRQPVIACTHTANASRTSAASGYATFSVITTLLASRSCRKVASIATAHTAPAASETISAVEQYGRLVRLHP